MPSNPRPNGVIASTEVPTSSHTPKPDAIDILGNSGPLLALLITLGTVIGLYRKWRDIETKRGAREALLEKRVDDSEATQREVKRRMSSLESQVHDHSVTIGRIETRIEDIAKTNDRIEKNIDRILDKVDGLAAGHK